MWRGLSAVAPGHDVAALLAAGGAQVLGLRVPLRLHQPQAHPLKVPRREFIEGQRVRRARHARLGRG